MFLNTFNIFRYTKEAKPRRILFLLFLEFEAVVLKFNLAWTDYLTFINTNLEIEVVNFEQGMLCKRMCVVKT